jgi:predicted phosphodiesterase
MGVKILVTGYTHSPKIETAGDVLLICPGSPTEPNLSKPTVILLKVEDGSVEVEPVVVAPPTCSVFTFEPPNEKNELI